MEIDDAVAGQLGDVCYYLDPHVMDVNFLEQSTDGTHTDSENRGPPQAPNP